MVIYIIPTFSKMSSIIFKKIEAPVNPCLPAVFFSYTEKSISLSLPDFSCFGRAKYLISKLTPI